MNKFFSRVLGLSLLFCFAHTEALTKKGAGVAGTIASLATTTLASLCTSSVYKRAAIFGLSEYFWVNLFLQYTPENRYNWAAKTLEHFSVEPLFYRDLDTAELAETLQESGCESYELPLVSAFLKLQYYDKRLTYIQDELIRSFSDLEQQDPLFARSNELLSLTKIHLKRVRANEAFIKSQPQWLDQWRLYQERQLAKERLERYDRINSHIIWHINPHY